MNATSVIGIVQPDGGVLCARAPDGDDLAAKLTRHYGTRLRATMLASLGDLAFVGSTPALCVMGSQPDPEMLPDVDAFEALHDAGAARFHLFDASECWIVWSDRRVPGPSMLIDMED